MRKLFDMGFFISDATDYLITFEREIGPYIPNEYIILDFKTPRLVDMDLEFGASAELVSVIADVLTNA